MENTFFDPNSSKAVMKLIALLENKKSVDIVKIDLRNKSDIADYLLVCSGNSARHVVAIAQDTEKWIKATIGYPCKTEGYNTGNWILIDAGDILVHIFQPKVRAFYQIEKMWL